VDDTFATQTAGTPYKEYDDNALVKLCLEGDNRAWEEILRRYKKRIFNISYQFVGRMDEAEDLTQEIFFKVFHSLDKFNLEANLQYWIIRVSKNYCIDFYRKKRKERESLVGSMDHVANIKPTLSTPQLILEEKEKLQAIRESINSLPSILRTCIILRNLYGYSYHAIAEVLNIPEGTVKSRINRGRQELSKRLGLSLVGRKRGGNGREANDDDDDDEEET
jgi:RNA polymerase sigma-70 factor (ECF subfamily)